MYFEKRKERRRGFLVFDIFVCLYVRHSAALFSRAAQMAEYCAFCRKSRILRLAEAALYRRYAVFDLRGVYLRILYRQIPRKRPKAREVLSDNFAFAQSSDACILQIYQLFH